MIKECGRKEWVGLDMSAGNEHRKGGEMKMAETGSQFSVLISFRCTKLH
jgi:hypothetical protein